TQKFQTNIVLAHQTNLVTAYQTNLKTLNLTNWETVLVMRTNWITQPAHNVLQIQLPAPAPSLAAAPAPAKTEAPAEAKHAAAPVDLAQKMEFELTPNGKAIKPDQFPIQLALRTVGEPRVVLPVHEWRVERTDGGVLLLGSRPEFTATLPSGVYKI